MSNQIYIDAVSKDNSTHGFRAYDDYSSCCAFNWEKLPDDDLVFFEDIITSEYGYPPEFRDLIEFAAENDKGITIRGTYFDWSELEPIYKKSKTS